MPLAFRPDSNYISRIPILGAGPGHCNDLTILTASRVLPTVQVSFLFIVLSIKVGHRWARTIPRNLYLTLE